jgi:peptidoglycan/LPS O-acetylase OafA/YrhL
VNQPLVLPFHAVRGWREADPARRGFALVCLGMLALWPLLLTTSDDVANGFVLVTACLPGPPAFYSLARVLRPHVGRSAERDSRHWIAATSTCFGICTVLGLVLDSPVAVLAFPATLGLVLTLPWGFVALLVRSSQLSAAAAWQSGRPVHPPSFSR